MHDRSWEATGFQERAPYDPSIDLRTDFVMAYGLDDSTPERIARWREAGYRVHVMTGISWGQYQDYFEGRWDGHEHWDDAQTTADGKPILHGRSTDVPYVVPTIRFTEYLLEKLRPVIELGVEGVHLEEPEFWARGGYSESFKREWRAFYGEDWQPPHGSIEAYYRASRLKQHLLTRSLDRVTTVLRDDALQRGRDVRFYVPTHSLLNYTQWQIISPQSRLRTLPAVHGAIAQVWTGTARTQNVYAGRRAERTFETAYLEYGIAGDLTRGTDRTLWFLHDPIEDHAGRTWEDYRANYQRTLVASLLHPGVARFEVAPWPNRIFNRDYRREGSDERVPIPSDYATSYLVAMQTLRDMDQPVEHAQHGGARIAVALSDTAMFERWQPDTDSAGTHYDGLQNALTDEGRALLNFSGFYGLALPPLVDGQRVVPLQLEALLDSTDALEHTDVFVLSYEFQKPTSPAVHHALAGWVRAGGSLLYVGNESDPYHGIRDWWTGRYPTCVHHLAETLGLDLDTVDTTAPVRVGDGWVRFCRVDPASFTESPQAAAELLAILRELAGAAGHPWRSDGWLTVRRGPYLVGAVPAEAATSTRVDGTYLDLLDADLPIVRGRDVAPGELVWLRDLDYTAEPAQLLASAGRIRDWTAEETHVSFTCETPTQVEAVTAVRLPRAPESVRVAGAPSSRWRYDEDAGVAWIRHDGDPAGTAVDISLQTISAGAR